MKNLPKEQIFQLKSMALDFAVKNGTIPEELLTRAEAIYDWLTVEVSDKAVEGAIKLV